METTSVDIEHEIFKNSKSDVGYKNTMLRKVIVLLLLCSLEKSFLTIHSPPFLGFYSIEAIWSNPVCTDVVTWILHLILCFQVIHSRVILKYLT